MVKTLSEVQMRNFVEDIVKCFASADYGWTGLMFDEEEIEDVILKHMEGVEQDTFSELKEDTCLI